MIWRQYATTTYFSYRPDSQVDRIITRSPFTSDTFNFEYNGRLITHIYNLRTARFSDYTYNSNGQISAIAMNGYPGSDGDFRFEFTYDGEYRLQFLTSFLLKAGVKKQSSIYTYIYDFNGALAQVKGMTQDGVQIVSTLDSYSEPCYYNPWAFLDPVDPAEAFEIYNLPLMQQFGKLPAKITRTFPGGGFNRQLTATIEDHHLSRIVTASEYPATPSENYQSEIDFFYRH